MTLIFAAIVVLADIVAPYPLAALHGLHLDR